MDVPENSTAINNVEHLTELHVGFFHEKVLDASTDNCTIQLHPWNSYDDLWTDPTFRHDQATPKTTGCKLPPDVRTGTECQGGTVREDN